MVSSEWTSQYWSAWLGSVVPLEQSLILFFTSSSYLAWESAQDQQSQDDYWSWSIYYMVSLSQFWRRALCWVSWWHLVERASRSERSVRQSLSVRVSMDIINRKGMISGIGWGREVVTVLTDLTHFYLTYSLAEFHGRQSLFKHFYGGAELENRERSSTLSTMSVLLSPVRLSYRKWVSRLFLNGTWLYLLMVLLMTSPRLVSDLLMLIVSFYESPVTPDLLSLSLPARSIRCILLANDLPSCTDSPDRQTVQTIWERDECSLRLVVPVALFLVPQCIRYSISYTLSTSTILRSCTQVPLAPSFNSSLLLFDFSISKSLIYSLQISSMDIQTLKRQYELNESIRRNSSLMLLLNTPLLLGGPSMVYVLPEPVGPQAKIVTLNPSTRLSIKGYISWKNSGWSTDESTT